MVAELIYSFQSKGITYNVMRTPNFCCITDNISNVCTKVVKKYSSMTGLVGIDLQVLEELRKLKGGTSPYRVFVNEAILMIPRLYWNNFTWDYFIQTLNQNLTMMLDKLYNDCKFDSPKVTYERCLVPVPAERRYHNYKVFYNDTIEVFRESGQKIKGVVTEFRDDAIVIDNTTVVPLCSISNINVISRADGRSDWR